MTVTVAATGKAHKRPDGTTTITDLRTHPNYRHTPTTQPLDPNQDLPAGWEQPELFPA